MKNLIGLVFIAFSLLSSAQVMQPVAQGLPANPGWSTSNGTHSYFANYNWQTNRTQVHRWNGLAWVSLPELSAEVRALKIYQGNLYLAANGNGPGKLDMYKFQNGQWQTVQLGLSGILYDLEVYQNQLVLAGNFQINGTKEPIIAYDGQSFFALGQMDGNDTIEDLNVIQNELWAVGRFQLAINNDTAQAMYLDTITGNWLFAATKRAPNLITYGFARAVFGIGNKVYVRYWSGVYELRNDSLIEIATGINAFLLKYTELNGKVYMTDYYGLRVFDGQSAYLLNNLPPTGLYALEAFQGDLYVGFHLNQFSNQTFNYIFRVAIQNISLVRGQLFEDSNGNCSREDAENSALPFQFDLSQNGQLITVTGSGSFNVLLSPGNYSLSNLRVIDPLYRYNQVDFACSPNFSISTTASQTVSIDIPMKNLSPSDLGIDLSTSSGNRLRQGSSQWVYLKVSNAGYSYGNQIIYEVEIPNAITFESSIPPPVSSSGRVLTYSLDSLIKYGQNTVLVKVKAPVSATTIGNSYCFTAQILFPQSDVNPINNRDTACFPVIAAVDPNDKQANITNSLPGLSELEYRIRFQNTGNDTAFKVVLVDTLESYFYPNTIQLLDASHPYHFDIVKGTILVWTFDSILLPDSTTNEARSHGYVNFRIKLDSALADGSVIDNDAEIYFDYQPPVHTNHALTIIQLPVGLTEGDLHRVSVYPNPVEDRLKVEGLRPRAQLRIQDANGRQLRNYTANEFGVLVFDIQDLAPGLYLLVTAQATIKIIKE